LQQTDSETDDLRRRLAEVISLLGETHELSAARRRHEEAQEALAYWRTKQRDRELALRSLDRKSKSSEQRLYGGRIRNPKELSDLQDELESLGRRKSAIEDELLEAMLQVDECQAETVKAAEGLSRIEAEWSSAQAALRAEKEGQERRLAELAATHEDQIRATAPADVSSYEHLRKRKGGLAVTVLKGHECQGCMTTVSAARVREARSRDTLAYCGNCGRILVAT